MLVGCFVLMLTLASGAYLVYRFLQFQKWKSESELCEQMQQEIQQLKAMISDIMLDADNKQNPVPNQQSYAAQRERNPEEEA